MHAIVHDIVQGLPHIDLQMKWGFMTLGLPKRLRFGSLVQAAESQLEHTLMKDKGEQMLMIGTRIVQKVGGI
ncbi:hypothetical protein [Pseudomonas chlororaphis]|uniref:hypothetical protein n=1 Tax=Pseudomonas chlororaphis TaxID=587753 RepID=UPI000F55DD40|nr:hypothetical protein [Pseudomonas chlororaphis]MBP5090268.1 hypothetical protein [Pseudomonas chlororaphis]WDG74962.1 hypothetical protein PUP65_11530 [Pseudomonas chlororaphis]WDH27402.1 hypothetical protein PUP81_22780 [Pseudomonas chlororaphis]WDH73482.1 hypothetical protein PUP78_11525 [Pseudomonas chlororaphis]